jgi:hypothetical protein
LLCGVEDLRKGRKRAESKIIGVQLEEQMLSECRCPVPTNLSYCQRV